MQYELVGKLGWPVTGTCENGWWWFFHRCGFPGCTAPHSDIFYTPVPSIDDGKFFAVNGRCYAHTHDLDSELFEGKPLWKRTTIDELVTEFNAYQEAQGFTVAASLYGM